MIVEYKEEHYSLLEEFDSTYFKKIDVLLNKLHIKQRKIYFKSGDVSMIKGEHIQGNRHLGIFR